MGNEAEVTAPLTPEQRVKERDALLSTIKQVCGDVVSDIVETKFKTLAEARTANFTPPPVKGATTTSGTSTAGEAFPLGAQICSVAAGSKARKDGHAKSVQEGAVEWSTKNVGADAFVTKSLSAGEFVDSGMFIRGDVATTWTDLLTPKIAVLALNPVRIPMPSGTFTAPKVTSDVSAYYRGEAQDATTSRPTTGARSLKARELVIEVPISNKLLMRGGPDVMRFVQRLAVRRAQIRKDVALLRGDGTEHTPKGLTKWASQTLTAQASPTFAQILTNLGSVISALESANVGMESLGAIMAPRTKNFLMFQALNGFGVPFFLEEMRGGNLLGFPYKSTTNVPTNQGGSANESYMVWADFDNVLYGETDQTQIKVSEEASYKENGVLVSAFSRGETLMLLSEEHDLSVEHEEAVIVLDHITWGAS